MISRVLLVLVVLLAAWFFPARQATAAATYQEALSSCQARLGYAQDQNSFRPTWPLYPVSCDADYPHSRYWFTTLDGENETCGSYGDDILLGPTCDWPVGYGPPDCKAGRVVPTSEVTHYSDGTECDSDCALTYIMGGALNGQRTTTGNACIYSSNNPPPASGSSSPPPAPPSTTSPPPPQPPECNADGSCKYCIGDVCVTTGGKSDPGPPPPSASSTGDDGNHDTTSQTSYYGGSGPSGGSSSGGPGSGSSSGGTGPTPPTSADTKCKDGVCDVGEADGAMGGMYQHSDQTPGGIFGGYMNSVRAAPIIGAAGAFFQVSAGGSCPTWHIPGNKYWGEAGFDFSFFCSPAMLALFQLAGFLVLAAGAFCAFRIALY